MTELELTNILKRMYKNTPRGNAVTMVHLFGIKYASELQKPNISIKNIATNSVGSESYITEIYKGIRLARHVNINADAEELIAIANNRIKN